jgi:hypothetical protein
MTDSPVGTALLSYATIDFVFQALQTFLMLRYREKRTTDGLEVRFLRLFDALRPIKSRVQFQSDGISIVTRILGVPIHRKWFDRSLIYGFGHSTNGHSRSQLLQFNYAGEAQIVFANFVLEGEVAAFLRHLHEEGFNYNTSWERPSTGSGPILGQRP